MNDLISRQAAIEVLEEPCKVSDTWTDEYAVGERMQWEKDVKALNSLPSAERHGRWEIADDMPRLDNTFTIRCSLCGQLMLAHPNDENPNFCCNCGASMTDDNAIQHKECVDNALGALDEEENK